MHQILLSFPVNPFDHEDLLEAGYREWSRTSDALLSGRRLPRMFPLLREGLRQGLLRLVLLQQGDEGGAAELELQRSQSGLSAVASAGNSLSVDPDGRFVGDLERKSGGGILAFDQSHYGYLHDSLLSPNSIAQVLGFDILFVVNGWLSGALLYLKPEHRGQGLPEAYFRIVLALAKAKGLKGFRFLSTLPRWERCKIFHRELHLVQKDGTPVYAYWKAVS